MSLRHIKLVMFDMAGTTIDDRLAGSSLVVSSFVEAFSSAGIEVAPEQVHRQRGKEKRGAILSILREHNPGRDGTVEEQARTIYAAFIQRLEAGIGNLREMEGTREVLLFLKRRGIRTGVGSGFPQEVVQAIVDRFRWQVDGLVDYVGCAETTGASRPDPKMILDAMSILGVAEPTQVLKVGDTTVDIQEGKNAGAQTVGVLTGSQSEQQLRAAGADYILSSVALLPKLFA